MDRKSGKPPKPLKILVNLFSKSKRGGGDKQRSASDMAASRETVGSRECNR